MVRFIALTGLLTLAWLSPACRQVDEPSARGGVVAVPPARLVDPKQTPKPAEPSVGGRTVVVPDFATVATRVGPSVVSVIATIRGRDQGSQRALRGLGSGTIVSANGQILTNQHVIADASTIEVELPSRMRVAARVVHADPRLDLALLEIRSDEPVVPIEFAEREPMPGEWVMAIGQPFGLGHTITVGVVSGLGRDYADLGRPPGLDPEGIWSFIQTDASINIGNSGGPLTNADGKLLGLTTAVRNDGQGLAFAVPAAMIRRFLQEVWTYGRVRHARLGVRGENATSEQLPGRAELVRVTQVQPGGPGAKAGLAVGDLILSINDEPVYRVSDVAYRTQLFGVGAKLTLVVKRGTEPPKKVLLIPTDSR